MKANRIVGEAGYKLVVVVTYEIWHCEGCGMRDDSQWRVMRRLCCWPGRVGGGGK